MKLGGNLAPLLQTAAIKSVLYGCHKLRRRRVGSMEYLILWPEIFMDGGTTEGRMGQARLRRHSLEQSASNGLRFRSLWQGLGMRILLHSEDNKNLWVGSTNSYLF